MHLSLVQTEAHTTEVVTTSVLATSSAVAAADSATMARRQSDAITLAAVEAA